MFSLGRLSLENAGIPAPQFSALRVLSVALLGAYAYLTLCRDNGSTVASAVMGEEVLLRGPDTSSLLAAMPSDIGVSAYSSPMASLACFAFPTQHHVERRDIKLCRGAIMLFSSAHFNCRVGKESFLYHLGHSCAFL